MTEIIIPQTGAPPNETLVRVFCDDYMGNYTMLAMRKDYKQPKKGQCKKGFRKGWRWIKENGDTLERKEIPSAWEHLTEKGK